MDPACPSTMQRLRIGIAVDFGFARNQRATTTPLTAGELAFVQAEVASIVSLANVLYADMLNVFVTVDQLLIQTTVSTAGATWNQVMLVYRPVITYASSSVVRACVYRPN